MDHTGDDGDLTSSDVDHTGDDLFLSKGSVVLTIYEVDLTGWDVDRTGDDLFLLKERMALTIDEACCVDARARHDELCAVFADALALGALPRGLPDGVHEPRVIEIELAGRTFPAHVEFARLVARGVRWPS
ncbi:MAG: hypothetical protein ACMG6S_06395 [Byssovorax sp.]